MCCVPIASAGAVIVFAGAAVGVEAEAEAGAGARLDEAGAGALFEVETSACACACACACAGDGDGADADAGAGAGAGFTVGVGVGSGGTASGTVSFARAPSSRQIPSIRRSNAISSSIAASHIWYHIRVPIKSPSPARTTRYYEPSMVVVEQQHESRIPYGRRDAQPFGLYSCGFCIISGIISILQPPSQ
eukprot:COSAG02_NODE_1218_length_13814_cov_250.988844_9_plen_190_part_00